MCSIWSSLSDLTHVDAENDDLLITGKFNDAD